MSALIATYLSYNQFFNVRHQLVARNSALNAPDEEDEDNKSQFSLESPNEN